MILNIIEGIKSRLRKTGLPKGNALHSLFIERIIDFVDLGDSSLCQIGKSSKIRLKENSRIIKISCNNKLVRELEFKSVVTLFELEKVRSGLVEMLLNLLENTSEMLFVTIPLYNGVGESRQDLSFNEFSSEYKMLAGLIAEFIKEAGLEKPVCFSYDRRLTCVFSRKDDLRKKLVEKFPVEIIIPVYNEEATVDYLVRAVANYDLASKVFVVDDGSKDKSRELLKSIYSPKVEKILLQENHGKGYAVATAAERLSGRLTLMIDSDVEKISDRHLDFLVIPMMIFGQELRSTIGKFGDDNITYAFKGERCYWTDEFKKVSEEFKTSRYGIETILNYRVGMKNNRYIPLPGFKHLMKIEKKLTRNEAALSYMKEGVEIAIVMAELHAMPEKEIQMIKKFGRDLSTNATGKLSQWKSKFSDPMVSYILSRYYSIYTQIKDQSSNSIGRIRKTIRRD